MIKLLFNAVYENFSDKSGEQLVLLSIKLSGSGHVSVGILL